MKITKRQLRQIVKESKLKLKLLNEEPSDYYKDYRSGSISYEEYQQMVKDYEVRTGGSGTRNSNYRPSPRKTYYVGSDANADQIAAVEAALSAKPNNFLTSVLKQLKNGRGLSDKQNSIVKRIVSKNDPSASALFESDNKIKITRQQLRRIIKEAVLSEALPPHLQKHFRKDGSSVNEPELQDVTPAGYGPGDMELSMEVTPESKIALFKDDPQAWQNVSNEFYNMAEGDDEYGVRQKYYPDWTPRDFIDVIIAVD